MVHTQKEYYYNEHDENQVKKILKTKKKKKLKKRIKILFVLIVLTVIGAYFLSDYSKVQSIKVVGNEELKEKTIIENISINKNTIYLFIDRKGVAQEVKDLGMVKRANVSVDFLGHVTIEIEEAEKVAYCEIGKKIYLIDELGGVVETNDKNIIESLQSCPRILKFKDLKFLKTFAKEYIQIPELIKSQTSDIVYDPNELDETRLKFVMDNGKILYLRTEDMVEQLKKFDYEAYMTQYSKKCVFSFEGKYIYMKDCK